MYLGRVDRVFIHGGMWARSRRANVALSDMSRVDQRTLNI